MQSFEFVRNNMHCRKGPVAFEGTTWSLLCEARVGLGCRVKMVEHPISHKE